MERTDSNIDKVRPVDVGQMRLHLLQVIPHVLYLDTCCSVVTQLSLLALLGVKHTDKRKYSVTRLSSFIIDDGMGPE